MNNLMQYQWLKSRWMPFCLLLGLLAVGLQATGQIRPEQPPRPLTVNNLQGLNFGAFVQGGVYGEVIISPEGSRSATGTIILTNISSNFNAAQFEIDAEPGTLITIGESMTTLTGSNGGTLVLELGKSITGNPFIVPYSLEPGQKFPISIGGILKVGSLEENPAGFYSGIIQVTFIQE